MTDKDVKLVSTEELGEMNAQTGYLSPIFGSYASDVEMPVDKLNHDRSSRASQARSSVSTSAQKVMRIRTSARSFRPIWSLRQLS